MPPQFHVIIQENSDLLSEAGATLFAESAEQAVVRKGLFTVALSGGSTPQGYAPATGKSAFSFRHSVA